MSTVARVVKPHKEAEFWTIDRTGPALVCVYFSSPINNSTVYSFECMIYLSPFDYSIHDALLFIMSLLIFIFHKKENVYTRN